MARCGWRGCRWASSNVGLSVGEDERAGNWDGGIAAGGSPGRPGWIGMARGRARRQVTRLALCFTGNIELGIGTSYQRSDA